LRRSLTSLQELMRRIRHHAISDQVGEINAFLRGHYAYYGVNRRLNGTPRIASGRNVTRDEGLRAPQTGLEAAASSVEGLWAGRSDHYTQRRPQPRAVFPPAAWIR